MDNTCPMNKKINNIKFIEFFFFSLLFCIEKMKEEKKNRFIIGSESEWNRIVVRISRQSNKRWGGKNCFCKGDNSMMIANIDRVRRYEANRLTESNPNILFTWIKFGIYAEWQRIYVFFYFLSLLFGSKMMILSAYIVFQLPSVDCRLSISFCCCCCCSIEMPLIHFCTFNFWEYNEKKNVFPLSMYNVSGHSASILFMCCNLSLRSVSISFCFCSLFSFHKSI